MSNISRGLSAASAIACLFAAVPAFSENEAVPEANGAKAMSDEAGASTAAEMPAPVITARALPDPAPLARALAPVAADASALQDEPAPAFTVSGSATLASDYRFRGVSQTDEGMAVQGGVTISHESGLYVGAWGSNLSGWGTFGGANMELDLIAGYATPVGAGKLDAGLVWYMYPSGADTTDFAELYVKLSGDVGPVSLTGGVAYAPSQEALGRVFFTGAAAAAGLPDDPGDKEDNLYLFADAVYGIGETPLTLKAHLGYSDGNSGLGPNGTSVAPTGTYFDWLLGVDFAVIDGLTVSAAYVDTDISSADAAVLQPNFATLAGNSISDATVVFSVTAAF